MGGQGFTKNPSSTIKFLLNEQNATVIQTICELTYKGSISTYLPTYLLVSSGTSKTHHLHTRYGCTHWAVYTYHPPKPPPRHWQDKKTHSNIRCTLRSFWSWNRNAYQNMKQASSWNIGAMLSPRHRSSPILLLSYFSKWISVNLEGLIQVNYLCNMEYLLQFVRCLYHNDYTFFSWQLCHK